MYKKASSELVVARRRRGSHDRAEDVCVAAADRVQGPLGEDDGDDAVRRGSDCEALRIRLWVYLSEAKNLGLYVAAEARLFFRINRALRRR